MKENKFTLKNFEKWIDPGMLKKGKAYYDDGNVLSVEENNGTWTAEIEGTETYEATVSLRNGQEITEYYCNCPYDGDICKHLVSMFFAMREEIKILESISKKKTAKNPFESLLANVVLEEYQDFTRSYASKNKDFKLAFELFFADKDDRIDVGEKYADLVRKLAKKYSSRGYVDYRGSSGLSNEVGAFLAKASELVNKKNFKDAFAIAKSVLQEMLQVLTYSDDSNGSMSGTAFEAVELIGTIATNDDVAVDMKQQMFDALHTELNNSDYFGYGDFGYELFYIYEELAVLLGRDKEFLDYIDTQLPKLKSDYESYRKEFFQKHKISFLIAIGRKAEAETLIQQNMSIIEVRQREVDKAIEIKDYEKAKILIAEGIEIAEAKKHPGTVSQWERQLLIIAGLENDITLVRRYCKRFAFDRHFNNQYYNQLKQTYTKDEWYKVLEAIIVEIKVEIIKEAAKRKWGSPNSSMLEALAPIFIEEGYWDRLFDFVKNENRLSTVMHYHNYLSSKYPAELIELYLPIIELEADNASSRSHYAELAKQMKKMIKDIPSGKEKIMLMAQKLKLKYPRRPAMIDELNGL